MVSDDRRTALIVAVIGAVAIGHAVIFIRLADDAPALLLAAGRVIVATLVFAPFAWRHTTATSAPERRLIWISALSGVLLALHFAAWIGAVQRLSIAESAVLVSLSPIWIVVIEALSGRGRPPTGVLVGIALCMVGVAVIGWDGISNPEGDPMGMAMALAGGVTMAGYLAVGKRVRDGLSTSQYVTVCYGAASICLIAAYGATGGGVSGIGATAWMAVLALGLVSQVAGHTAYNFSLRALSPTFVAICLLSEPILGSLFGLLYLGEAVPPLTVLGAAPILMGLWLAMRAELRR